MWIVQAGVLVSLTSLIFTSTQAILVNRTIDDTYGDSVTGQIPVYQPTNPWAFPNCSGCAIVPDKTKAFDETWSAATYDPSKYNNINITLSFTGVSVWVFFILANANVLGTSITSNTQCNFTLDGNLMNTFNHQPDETTLDLQYNATVFTATGLSNSSHQLVISTNDFPISVYINFDYAIYTVDEPDNTTSSTSGPFSTSTPTSTSTSRNTTTTGTPRSTEDKVGIIVGCVLGGLALPVLVVALVLFRRSRRARRESIVPTDAITTLLDLDQQLPPGLGYRDDVAASNTSSHLLVPSTYNQTHRTGSLFDQSSHAGSPSSDLASPILAPLRPEHHSPHPLHRTKSQEMEINQRLQQEMRELISRQSQGPGSSSNDTRRESEVDSMREQIRVLSSRIEHLQAERTSDWDHRSTRNSEPPPAYGT